MTHNEPIKSNKPFAENAGRVAAKENHTGYNVGMTNGMSQPHGQWSQLQKAEPGN